jgi:hypothetical protein
VCKLGSSHSHYVGMSDDSELEDTKVRWPKVIWCPYQFSWKLATWFKSYWGGHAQIYGKLSLQIKKIGKVCIIWTSTLFLNSFITKHVHWKWGECSCCFPSDSLANACLSIMGLNISETTVVHKLKNTDFDIRVQFSNNFYKGCKMLYIFALW